MVTILATGGAGQVYVRTTNPGVATGDGMAMAYRAGAVLRDLEFVQFHPTGLAVGAGPTAFLVTEALRGEGAYLRNAAGERFMVGRDPKAELAARDVVVRAMVAEMRREGSDHVYLDARHLDAGMLRSRFPRVTAGLAEHGLDLARDLIPVAPVSHYFIGGVVDRCLGPHQRPRPVRQRRGGQHLRARRQSAGVQLAARGPGLLGPGRARPGPPYRRPAGKVRRLHFDLPARGAIRAARTSPPCARGSPQLMSPTSACLLPQRRCARR